MARRMILIKHEDSPGDDRAAAWFAEQGFVLDWRTPYTGEPLPAFDDSVAGALLYGGPQSAADANRLRYLADEGTGLEPAAPRDPAATVLPNSTAIAKAPTASNLRYRVRNPTAPSIVATRT